MSVRSTLFAAGALFIAGTAKAQNEYPYGITAMSGTLQKASQPTSEAHPSTNNPSNNHTSPHCEEVSKSDAKTTVECSGNFAKLIASTPQTKEESVITPHFSAPIIFGNGSCQIKQTNPESPIVSGIVVGQEVTVLGTTLKPNDVVLDYGIISVIIPKDSRTMLVPPQPNAALGVISLLEEMPSMPETAARLRKMCLAAKTI